MSCFSVELNALLAIILPEMLKALSTMSQHMLGRPNLEFGASSSCSLLLLPIALRT